MNQSGDEELIVTAARISYGKKAYQDDRDAQLLEKLIQLGHWTPFEHVHLTFFIRCPIYVWRQWIRHRTAHVNERSMRYTRSTMLIEYGELSDNPIYNKAIAVSLDAYNQLLESYPKEKARLVLPLSTYTEAIWTIDLRNLLHFLELRLHKDAQKEIRLYAQIILEELEQRFPTVMNAFIEHRLKAITLSGQQAKILKKTLDNLNGDEELESIKNKLSLS
ncbi:MAG: FAD-dependent thymidylate synthase [Candidatus Caldarchaeum sp.]